MACRGLTFSAASYHLTPCSVTHRLTVWMPGAIRVPTATRRARNLGLSLRECVSDAESERSPWPPRGRRPRSRAPHLLPAGCAGAPGGHRDDRGTRAAVPLLV